MKLGRILWSAPVPLLLVTPAMAQDEPIDCMAASYTDEERDRISELSPQIAFLAEAEDDPASEQIANVVIEAVERCGERLDWGEGPQLFAYLYEMGRLSEVAFRASDELSQGELAMFDRAFLEQEAADFWQVVERGVLQGLGVEEARLDSGDLLILGKLIVEAGFEDTVNTGEKVGAFAGLIGLQRVGKREFETAQMGEM